MALGTRIGRGTLLALGVVVAAIATASSACSGETGGAAGVGSATASSSTGGPLTFTDTPCGKCVADACSAALAACNADPECVGFASCLFGCGVDAQGDVDAACADACPHGSSTESQAAAAELEACRTKGAGKACADCGGSGGGGGGGGGPSCDLPLLNETCPPSMPQGNPCFECEDEKCCDAYVAYKANPEAVALKDCWAACTDADCEKACVAQHPDGADDFGARLACLYVACAADVDMCNRPARSPCNECLYGTCGCDYAKFEAGPDGYALYVCIVACPVDDTACDQVCYDAYPAAYARYGDWAACVSVSCEGKC